MLSVGIPDILVLVVALIIVWAIASLPVYIAGKIVTGGRASFGAAWPDP